MNRFYQLLTQNHFQATKQTRVASINYFCHPLVINLFWVFYPFERLSVISKALWLKVFKQEIPSKLYSFKFKNDF